MKCALFLKQVDVSFGKFRLKSIGMGLLFLPKYNNNNNNNNNNNITNNNNNNKKKKKKKKKKKTTNI